MLVRGGHGRGKGGLQGPCKAGGEGGCEVLWWQVGSEGGDSNDGRGMRVLPARLEAYEDGVGAAVAD